MSKLHLLIMLCNSVALTGFHLFFTQLFTVTSHSLDWRDNWISYVRRQVFLQEFKYLLLIAALLNQANSSFQSSLQLFSGLILLKVVILAADIAAQEQCEKTRQSVEAAKKSSTSSPLPE